MKGFEPPLLVVVFASSGAERAIRHTSCKPEGTGIEEAAAREEARSNEGLLAPAPAAATEACERLAAVVIVVVVVVLLLLLLLPLLLFATRGDEGDERERSGSNMDAAPKREFNVPRAKARDNNPDVAYLRTSWSTVVVLLLSNDEK